MGSIFQSFQKTSLGVYVQSPLGVRNGGGELIFAGNFAYTTSSKDIFDVGFISSNDFAKIGENEGFGGATGNSNVKAFAVYKKELYACGILTQNIDNSRTYKNIVKLNQGQGIWETLLGTDLSATANDMCVFGGQLIVVGSFANANGVALTKGVAAWDGESWTNLGDLEGDIGGTSSGNETCAIYNGELWVSGGFSVGEPGLRNFVIWNGTTWRITSDVFDAGDTDADEMTVFQDNIFAASNSALVEYDGSTFVNDFGVTGNIFAMAVFEGNLILGGVFNDINGTGPIINIATYDGNNFSEFAQGLGSDLSDGVFDLLVFDKKLYAIGDFGTPRTLGVYNPDTDNFDQVGINSGLTSSTGSVLATFSGNLTGSLPN